ncbi:NAD-dependent succinate-semialdehyde dehydrogenase [Pimelobacter sp. 30-1]|uniref:NAD-dependent succinate-semialdehyde dehydrogenase n=1 Tax=Pimelobacter sp. 30-1 TaxID=2004991 RepID=UPI001C05A118|nr:NAD-dependent succinate-semialdehyde dehydrogenase [Pimelobacter sp. 30-1]MBU2695161.1 succinate-semialdehyde dehydrogenase [Pimelobacter sp. 30-1]
MYATVNPATGELVESFDPATDAEVEAALSGVAGSFATWSARPLAERAAIVHRVADLFEERADELAAIITLEMGKRLEESRGEIDIVAAIFRYYADNGATFLADQELTIEGGRALVQKRPIGAVLGIMPWNYPYYQVARFAAPNLVLGNTIVLKHAPSCPRTALAIARVMADAGVPEDVYVNLLATNDQVATMIDDPRIQGVSLTGSERAGAAVAARAGQNLKKVVLELGGSDPMIVLDSADVAATAREAVASRMGNMGQACNAPKRMIVLADLYDDFLAGLVTAMGEFVPGDPADPATTLAPLSSLAAADKLVDQLERAVAQGATVHTGGGRVDRPGAFVEPTVLTGVVPGTDAYREELFGPVAIVFRAESEEEAVALANDTPFGLGSSVFSTDLERAQRVADRIDAGMVYLNAAGGSQPDLPFGGTKRSGIGRELGPVGMDEFANHRVLRIPAS